MSTYRALLSCGSQRLFWSLRLTLFSLAISALVAATGCGNSQSTTAAPEKALANPTISVTPANISIGSQASQQFSALVRNTSDTAVVWSASIGSITSTGLYHAPAVTGTQTVSVTATSAADSSISARIILTISPAQNTAALKILTSQLTQGSTGVSYNQTLSASGGIAPYKWNVSSGALPAGLQLNSSTGIISGTPSKAGNSSFNIAVEDSKSNHTIGAFALAVASVSTSNFDGPAELPRVYLQTTLADTPSPGNTTYVAAGGDFQSALNSASCGDTITLQAGATFSGVYYFPNKSCDSGHWITVRTSAPDSSLPSEGTRMTPCYAGVGSLPGRPALHCASTQNVLAKLVFGKKTGYGPVVFSSGANHYRLIGLEVTRNVGTGAISNLITPDVNVAADHIVLDRLWVHGTAQDETTRGVFMSGVTSIAVIDSFFTDFHCIEKTGTCVDAQAVAGGAGDLPMGPFKIVDNFLEASGENIIFGGAEATQTPTDIEIRQNHFFKPMTWMVGQPGFVGGADGNPFIVKNHFEIKNAQRILFEGNVLENNWGNQGQYGYSVLLTPRNQASGTQNICPKCQVTDVTIRYSTISHVGGVFEIANAASSAGGVAAAGERYSIHDVIADDVNDVTYEGRGTLSQFSTVPQPNLQDVQFDHITVFQPHVMFNVGIDVTQKVPNFRFTNNIVNAGTSPFTTTGGGTANCAYNQSPLILLNACFAPYSFSNNAIIGLPSNAPATAWPSGNWFPATATDVQFVNYKNGNGGDYHLLSSSPYKNAGTDGRDLGADVDAVLSAIAGAL
jgi:hypothetical protein